MASTTNYKLTKPSYTSSADISELNNNFDTIDKGLTLDVGSSTGTGNNYILDLGNITLSSDNKGLALRFFADKNANGNVVIVINNINYNLLKTNGKNVKNLKSGSPYIIIFNGIGNFFLASGGGNEDETNITASDVLLNKTFIGQDGEVSTGTMPNNGSINASLGANGTCIIPKGYTEGGKVTQSIPTQAGSITTPGTTDKTIVSSNKYVTGDIKVKGDANLKPSNIANGVRIFDVVGTAVLNKATGGTATFSSATESTVTINLGYQPSLVMVSYYDYDGSSSEQRVSMYNGYQANLNMTFYYANKSGTSYKWSQSSGTTISVNSNGFTVTRRTSNSASGGSANTLSYTCA